METNSFPEVAVRPDPSAESLDSLRQASEALFDITSVITGSTTWPEAGVKVRQTVFTNGISILWESDKLFIDLPADKYAPAGSAILCYKNEEHPYAIVYGSDTVPLQVFSADEDPDATLGFVEAANVKIHNAVKTEQDTNPGITAQQLHTSHFGLAA